MNNSRFHGSAAMFGNTSGRMVGFATLLGLTPLCAQQTPPPDNTAPQPVYIQAPQTFVDNWARHFRIGAVVGLGISADFKNHGTFGVTASPGTYDDGYVKVDQTGNAGGFTTFWGYKNASQYDSSSQTLTMHSTTSFTVNNSATEDSGPIAGFDMAYGDSIWRWNRVRLGWEAGFDLLPISITHTETGTANVTQETFSFGTGNIVIPTAPYNGGPSGFGQPVISATGTDLGSTNLTGNVTGTQSIDGVFYGLRIGPSVSVELNRYLSVSAGAGPALGIMSGTYKFDENIAANGGNTRNHGSISSTDVLFGGFVNAAVYCHVQDNADIYVSAQFSPMEDATFSTHGREARLNMGSQVYVSAGVSWPF